MMPFHFFLRSKKSQISSKLLSSNIKNQIHTIHTTLTSSIIITMKSNLIHFVQWLFLAIATSDYASAFVSPSTRIRTVVYLSSTAAAEEEETTTTAVKTTLSTKDDGDFSFFDEASIYVRAGSGGQGSSTWKKAKKGANGIPDGGTGGRGGNIVLVLDPSLNTLAGLSRRALRPNAFGGGGAAASSKRMSRHLNKLVDDDDESAINENNFVVRERLLSFRAEDGRAGGRMYDNGRCGEDCEVRVPPGTVVKLEFSSDDGDGTDEENNTNENDDDNDDDESINSSTSNDDEGPQEEYDHIVELGTVSYESPSLIVARGGKGGEGTGVLKGKKNGATRRGPVGGERFRVRLTLKIVADIALVGVPNAGKSTFLAAVTRAKPRIADYPFTTVVPNLGTWIPGDMSDTNTNRNKDGERGREKERAAGSNGLVLCDVPGLIAGASEGVGLGHAFLRHIERCRVILHLIDATGDDPVGDLAMVNDELRRYGSGSLAKKPQVVIVNKIDAAWEGLEDEEEIKQKREELADKIKEEMGHTRLMWISAKEKDGVDGLMTRMASYVGTIKEEQGNEVTQ